MNQSKFRSASPALAILIVIVAVLLPGCAPPATASFQPVVLTTSGDETEPLDQRVDLPWGEYRLRVVVEDPDSPRDGDVCGVTTNLANDAGAWVLEVGDSVTTRRVLSGSAHLDAGTYSLFVYNGCATTITLDKES